MNGKFLAEHTKLENNEALYTIATAPTPTARRVETLYLLVLSRLPRPEETARLVEYIENGGSTRPWTRGSAGGSFGLFQVGAAGRGEEGHAQAVADVYWAL